MSDNKNLTPDENANAMMSEGFVLVLNKKGAEWLKQQKSRPNQREEIRRKAALLRITSFDITKK